jgi:ribosomal protein L40E
MSGKSIGESSAAVIAFVVGVLCAWAFAKIFFPIVMSLLGADPRVPCPQLYYLLVFLCAAFLTNSMLLMNPAGGKMTRDAASGDANTTARFCIKCGKRVPSSADFCPSCGQKVMTDA